MTIHFLSVRCVALVGAGHVAFGIIHRQVVSISDYTHVVPSFFGLIFVVSCSKDAILRHFQPSHQLFLKAKKEKGEKEVKRVFISYFSTFTVQRLHRAATRVIKLPMESPQAPGKPC